MKILHVWDQAGVACVLSKYLKKENIQSEVFKRQGYDPFHILEFYGFKEQKSFFGAHGFLRNAINQSKNYDIIHLHDIYEIIPQLISIGKKIVLHYHGSKLRITPYHKREKAENLTNLILVSTSDLLKYSEKAIYLPNPVDLDHFCLLSKTTKPMPLPRNIKYQDMPKYISNFGFYKDYRIDNNQNELPLSLLALQCLAENLTVINQGKEYKGLPKEHHPKNVVNRLIDLYEKM
ncbi:MAG: hypothetical protein OEL69_09965 [Nitrosopumilus sp.]|jgi:hypothetical protein|nr:hypothetical protein [Nitrosopumilus sp.]